MSLTKTTLLKYVFLADYYYATENKGETFTKCNDWKFISFGPFSDQIIETIANLKAKNAIYTQAFQNDDGNTGEIFSYKSKDPQEFNSLFRDFPDKPRNLLGHAMNNLGSDMYKVLDFVYSQTQVMDKAIPYAKLDFKTLEPYDPVLKVNIRPVQGKALRDAKALLAKITEQSKKTISKIELGSIYDEAYFQAKNSDVSEPLVLRGTVNFEAAYRKAK